MPSNIKTFEDAKKAGYSDRQILAGFAGRGALGDTQKHSLASSVFDDILLRGVRAGQMPARTKKAREWYRGTAGAVGTINERTLIKSDPKRMVGKVELGKMYMFFYDPKWKKELPYYDKFPLIFPFEQVDKGFLGINLHYLPLRFRAVLMDHIYSTANNKRYDESTKLKLNYEALKRASNNNYFKPCIKHYLNSHVKSNFMYVYPSEWDIALFLPLQRFEKAGSSQVWAESKRIIRG